MNDNEKDDGAVRLWVIHDFGTTINIIFAKSSARASMLHQQDCELHGYQPRVVKIEAQRWSRLDRYLQTVGKAACERGIEGIGYLEIGRGWLICGQASSRMSRIRRRAKLAGVMAGLLARSR